MKSLAALTCLAASAFAQSDDRVKIDNGQVKVLKVVEQPHAKTKPHKHDVNRVMVYLESGHQKFEYPETKGSKPVTFHWKAGEVKWSEGGQIHAAELVTPTAMTILEIELKQPANPAYKPEPNPMDPLKLDKKHYKLEFENAQVRVLRTKIGPHGSVPMHRHPLNRVTVFLTDQDFEITDSKGVKTPAKHKAGDVAWGAPIEHTEKNLSDKPFEVLSIELKK